MNEHQPVMPFSSGPGRQKMNKKISVILVCVSLSAVFWLLINLSHNYSASLSFPVVYRNLPNKKVVMNDLPSRINLTIKTSGFKIIAFNFRRKNEPVEVDVAQITTAFNNLGDVLVVPTQSFLPDFNKQLGNDVNITAFQPDSIVFYFSEKIYRKIPVKLSLDVKLEKQYDTTGSPVIVPDSVLVSGPPSVISRITSISTERIYMSGVHETSRQKVKIVSNKLLSYDVEEVNVTIPVEKFTEGTLEVPVHAINVPAGYSLKTFPDKVKVRYLIPLSKYSTISASMFEVVVDASRLKESSSQKLSVSLLNVPADTRDTWLDPEKVDFILHKQ